MQITPDRLPDVKTHIHSFHAMLPDTSCVLLLPLKRQHCSRSSLYQGLRVRPEIERPVMASLYSLHSSRRSCGTCADERSQLLIFCPVFAILPECLCRLISQMAFSYSQTVLDCYRCVLPGISSDDILQLRSDITYALCRPFLVQRIAFL